MLCRCEIDHLSTHFDTNEENFEGSSGCPGFHDDEGDLGEFRVALETASAFVSESNRLMMPGLPRCLQDQKFQDEHNVRLQHGVLPHPDRHDLQHQEIDFLAGSVKCWVPSPDCTCFLTD